MKKIVALLLVSSLALLASCTDTNETQTTTKAPVANEEVTTETPTETPVMEEEVTPSKEVVEENAPVEESTTEVPAKEVMEEVSAEEIMEEVPAEEIK